MAEENKGETPQSRIWGSSPPVESFKLVEGEKIDANDERRKKSQALFAANKKKAQGEQPPPAASGV